MGIPSAIATAKAPVNESLVPLLSLKLKFLF